MLQTEAVRSLRTKKRYIQSIGGGKLITKNLRTFWKIEKEETGTYKI